LFRFSAAASCLLFFTASFLLFGLRDWLIWGGRLLSPAAVPRVPSLLLHNQLQGWCHAGTLPATTRWNAASLKAAAVWEWLPALFFMAGLTAWALGLRRWALGTGPGGPSPCAQRPAPKAQRLPVWVSLWLLLVANLISWLAFRHVPHVQDSIAQLFQARIFAGGRLWVPVPPQVGFVGMEFLVEDHGRWYCQYPPGHAALLALGVLLRAPWLVNPLLGALSAFAVYGAARAAYGTRLARMSVGLFGLSPFVWFMSGEYMNHASTMLLGALALWAAAVGGRQKAEGSRQKAVSSRGTACLPTAYCLLPTAYCLLPALSGALVGLAATVRPLTAAAFVPPLALYWLALPGSRRSRIRRLVLFGLACGLATVPMLLFNRLTTGSPFRFGYEVRWGASGIGFGHSQWGPPHTPARGLAQTWSNFDALNKYLLAWPFPCLLPLLGLVPIWYRRRRFDLLLLGWSLSLLVIHFFYFYQDLCFGPRFLYCATPALVILLARGISGVGEGLRGAWGMSRGAAARTAWRLALFTTGAGLLLNLPGLCWWYSTSFWGVDPRFVRRLEEELPEPAIVFVTDANRAREVRLREAGVSMRVAHSATTWLDEAWIDRAYLKTLARFGDDRAGAAAHLEKTLRDAAVCDDPQPRRKRVPWLDYRGPIGSYAQAFVGIGPDLERQRIIYALDLGAENRAFIAAHPGRTPWKFTWDPAEGSFHLVRLNDWVATGNGTLPPGRVGP
jgi:hypothetical protein